MAYLSGRTAVQLVAISLEDFSREILSAHEDLDPFRLHEDLQFFLGSFVSDVGRAMAVRPGRFTLALADFDPHGLDVFAHQLTLFLGGLFGDGTVAPVAAPGGETARADTSAPWLVRILKTARWPADGADLRALLESLSS